MPNDFVWIFAGGTPPNDFLKKIGVGFGARDLTLDASKEAKEAECFAKTARSSRGASALEAAHSPLRVFRSGLSESHRHLAEKSFEMKKEFTLFG